MSINYENENVDFSSDIEDVIINNYDSYSDSDSDSDTCYEDYEDYDYCNYDDHIPNIESDEDYENYEDHIYEDRISDLEDDEEGEAKLENNYDYFGLGNYHESSSDSDSEDIIPKNKFFNSCKCDINEEHNMCAYCRNEFSNSFCLV